MSSTFIYLFHIFRDLSLPLTCVFVHMCVQILKEAEESIPRCCRQTACHTERASGILSAGPSLELHSSVSTYCASFAIVSVENMWKNSLKIDVIFLCYYSKIMQWRKIKKKKWEALYWKLTSCIACRHSSYSSHSPPANPFWYCKYPNWYTGLL